MFNGKIKAIMFDVGNIFVTFDDTKAYNNLSLYSPYSGDEIRKALEAVDSPKCLHEAGKISSVEFFTVLQTLLKLHGDLSFERFCFIWADIFTINEDILNVMNKIKPEINMCLLSNTDPIHWPIIQKVPAIEKFFPDEQIQIKSYISKVSKPDMKIYIDALNCLGFKVEESSCVLFIEDIAENRATFENIGGNTLSYNCSIDTIDILEDGLRKYGVI